MNCKWSNRLYRALPLAGVRHHLIKSHLASCPACARQYLGDGDVRRLGVRDAQLAQQPPLWPELVWRLPAEKPASAAARMRPTRGLNLWLAAGVVCAGIMLVCAAYVIIVLPGKHPAAVPLEDVAAAPVFALHSATLYGQPANTVIFKAPQEPVVVVWFEAGAPAVAAKPANEKKNG